MSSKSCTGQQHIHCQNCSISELCLLFSLNDKELDSLDNIIDRKRPIHKGEQIFNDGQPMHALYAIRSGTFKTYTVNEQGEEQKRNGVGLEAITRRGYEIAAKTSLLLAIPEGMRTAEHVLWAFALAKKDIDGKIRLAYSTDNPNDISGRGAKILSLVTADHAELASVLHSRLGGRKKISREDLDKLLEQMVDRGMLETVETTHATKGTKSVKYRAAK